jgi:cell wall-associated NlpC family hydrolase
MFTGVTVKASALRLALWKRPALRGRAIRRSAIVGLVPAALAATALSALSVLPVLPAQAATDARNAPGLHSIWANPTAVRLGWPALPGAMSYTYRLYQMDGVQVRSGWLPGSQHTVICRGLHAGWRYQAEVEASPGSPGSPGSGWYATVSVRLPLPGPPRELAYQWAETQAGARYRYGGQGGGGYDCSGLVRAAYRHAGIWLPRTTGQMLQYWRLDQESSPRQGDLVFFGTGHVELYAGRNLSFGAETSRTGTWWNRWWPGDWWPTAFYRVTGAG